MNIFTLEIWYDEGSICTFYTVYKGDNIEDIESETDSFFNKYTETGNEFEEKAFQLFRLITESIGNRYGAIDVFFDRIEDNAQALPPKPKFGVDEIKDLGINFPLRLYCYRITEKIVILFNGGIKDADTNQNSSNLNFKFNEAKSFVKKINDSLQSGLIEITKDGKYLKGYNNSKELIIY